MIPFFDQNSFIEFGRTAAGPFGYVSVKLVKHIPMAFYCEILLTNGLLEFQTVKIAKMPRRVFKRFINPEVD